MAFHKADIGCRPEAQYTYYEGCFLAIRVGHEGMPSEPPRPETPQKASCRPMSGGGGKAANPAHLHRTMPPYS